MRDLLAGGAIAILLLYLFRRIARQWRFHRGAVAELRAVKLAERAGYRVRAVQVPGKVTLSIDGQSRTLSIRADMLLERGFRRYIAEVKSGRVAPDPTSSATRRQLLEYAHAFDADGLLLFDMEEERIHEIRFERHPPRNRQRLATAAFWLGAGVILEWTLRVLWASVAAR